MIVFPNELDLNNSSCSITCIIDNKIVTVKLNNNDLIGKKSVNVTIYHIINAASYAPPTHNITFKSIINRIYNYSTADSSNYYKDLTNNLPSPLSLISNNTKYNNTKLGQSNSLSISINLTNSSPAYYLLTLAPQFQTVTPICSGYNTSYSCTYDSNKRIIIFTQTEFITASLSASFVIDSFYNSITTPQSSLISTLVGFSAHNYEVNRYNGTLLNWLPDCTFPCKDCLVSNTSACTSCYQNTSVSNFTYLYAANNQCLSACS